MVAAAVPAGDFESWRKKLWELIDSYRLGHDWPLNCRGRIKSHIEKAPLASPPPPVLPQPNLSAVILWLENGCNVQDAIKELKILQGLAIAAPVLPLSEWQPIETAPKDGSLFLCWVEAVRYGETDEGQQYLQDVSQFDFCQWRTQADIPDCGWFDPCCGQIGDQQGVTHWQPLPAPPITEPGAGGEG